MAFRRTLSPGRQSTKPLYVLKKTFAYMSQIELNKKIVGRESELTRLRTLINRNQRGGPPIVISGLAGIGKTTLARLLVEPVIEDTYWLDLFKNQRPLEEIDTFLKMLHDSSALIPRFVVLDGAEHVSDSELSESLGRLYNFKNIRNVLVTTRKRPEISFRSSEEISLSGLSGQYASQLLQAGLDTDLHASEIERIIYEVDTNPLAIQLIAEYLKKNPYQSLDKFLEGSLYELSRGLLGGDEVKIIEPSIVNATQKLIHKLKKTPRDVFQITPRQFEQMIAELMSEMGWEVELTQATRDGGKDILAYMNTGVHRFLCLVEAKKYREDRPVGVGIVRSLYGTFFDHQASSAMLVTSSYCSPDAKEFQKKHKYHLSLKEYTDLTSWIANYNQG